MMTKRVITQCLMFSLLVFGSVAYGQDKILWSDLSLEERQILQQLEPQWENLPAERQQRLRRGATRWQQMQPQERAQAQNQQRRFQNLSRQQQQVINQRFQQFNGLSLRQQRRLRNIQRRVRSLPPEQQRLLRERFEQQNRQRGAGQSDENRRRIQEVIRQTENALRRNGIPQRQQQDRPTRQQPPVQ